MLNFLVTCSSEFGNCCNDPALTSVLSIFDKLLNLIQIVVPIVLLCMATYQLIKLMQNPEMKNGIKTLTNKFLAAGIIFFIPMLVDVVMSMVSNTNLGQCYKNAQAIGFGTTGTYISINDKERKNFFENSGNYESGVKNPILGNGEYESGEGYESGSSPYATGVGAERMISVALGELGNHEGNRSHHKYEAYNGLDDSQPWCAAFVSWVAGAAGYLKEGIFPKFVGCGRGLSLFKNNTNAEVHYASTGYTPRAGDIIFFTWKADGSANHVGIVLSADSNYVYTVEGNTKCEGEAASKCAGTDGVSKKKRPRDKTVLAYVTPKYA